MLILIKVGKNLGLLFLEIINYINSVKLLSKKNYYDYLIFFKKCIKTFFLSKSILLPIFVNKISTLVFKLVYLFLVPRVKTRKQVVKPAIPDYSNIPEYEISTNVNSALTNSNQIKTNGVKVRNMLLNFF